MKTKNRGCVKASEGKTEQTGKIKILIEIHSNFNSICINQVS